MKPRSIAMLIQLCICLCGCGPDPEPVFPKFDSEAVIKGATRTWKNYLASFQGKPVKFYGEIAPALWSARHPRPEACLCLRLRREHRYRPVLS
jgi:hypothetical protein